VTTYGCQLAFSYITKQMTASYHMKLYDATRAELTMNENSSTYNLHHFQTVEFW